MFQAGNHQWTRLESNLHDDEISKIPNFEQKMMNDQLFIINESI
jgi:hypothetical protein